MRNLSFDVARCNGVGYEEENGVIAWRVGCENCLRRTAKGSDYQTMMLPPEIITFECEFYISPDYVHV